MPITNMSGLLRHARETRTAIGAFSVGSMEMIMGVVRAAERTRTPVILQIAEARLGNAPLELIGPMMVGAARSSEIPIVVHFDHGQTEKRILEALDMGFTSIMFDGSHLPFEDNITASRAFSAMASQRGVSFEAELGIVGGSEDGTRKHRAVYTDPDEAAAFTERVPLDALAVAIGNTHGHYGGTPNLRYDVLEAIAAKTSVPLVLHGGSGISDESFKRAVRAGVCKVNIATASFDAVVASARAHFAGDIAVNFFTLSEAMTEGVTQNILRHIDIFSGGMKP